MKQLLIQESKCMLTDICRDTVISFCNTTTDGCNRITVTSNGDSVSDGIFKTSRFKESHQRLRHGILTGLIELISRSDLVQRKVHRIVVLINIIPDLQHAFPSLSHEDCHSGSFCSFNTFWMVMRYLSDFLRQNL